MDLIEQMRTFVGLVDTGSLSAAARARRLSLAAVSRQLSTLEDELSSVLVVRTTRRLQVTPAGQRWYAHCARILRELEDARADVSEQGRARGSVVVSAPITLGLHHVVPRLEKLARTHPGIEVELRLEDHVVDLVGEGVDVAVRGGIAPPDSASIIAHPLFEFRRFAVASAAYLRRRGTPRHPRELDQHELLPQRRLTAAFTRWHFERDGETIEISPKGRLGSSVPLVLREWALAGAGIAHLPEWLVEGQALKVLLPGWTSSPIRAWALHRVELRGAPRIRALLEALAS